ncbi:DUF3035 domain-containing protein [Oceanicella sp. SM1341]|uniref:DUF3035 domain-containing protein n=1 Tax=Oceanicella sp. SM1341 TaxID=1548889 RepID=UPI001300440F|nr:DUF3035 domain-containing protein [Oceanicella sp. SM1341]
MAYRGIGTKTGMVLLMALGVAACGDGGTGERQSLLRMAGLRQPPPDEFLVVERRPLEMPGTYSALPAPNPAGHNRVDPQPERDVASLLSEAGATSGSAASAVPLSPGQSALMASAGTAEPGIRQTVAAEDAQREAGAGNYGLSSFMGYRFDDPYREDVLDPGEEAERLRAEGVRTPAAPPREQEAEAGRRGDDPAQGTILLNQ